MSSTREVNRAFLSALANPCNDPVWGDFLALYIPRIQNYYRRRSVQDADAADLTQETLCKIARAIGRFVCGPAVQESFDAWVFCVARRTLIDRGRQEQRRPQAAGGEQAQDFLESLPSPSSREEDLEHVRHVVRKACRRVRHLFPARTWEAFWRTAIQLESAREVAADLGLSLIAVYRAQWAVQAALREHLSPFDAD